jgi:hypothetical protein
VLTRDLAEIRTEVRQGGTLELAIGMLSNKSVELQLLATQLLSRCVDDGKNLNIFID